MRIRKVIPGDARPARSAPGGEEAARDPQFVEAIARGFTILEAFTTRDSMLGNQEIAERSGLPRPTISRLTHTLTRLGYLEYLPRFAKYQLGIAAVALGQLALANMAVRGVARPLMEALSQRLGASVSLGRRDRLSMLYVEHAQPASAVALQLGLGSRLPLAVTAMGRAYYAVAQAEERAAIDQQIEERFPERWARVRDALHEAVDMHAALGFTISIGDWNREVHAAGAAIILPDGGIAAFNCGAPAFMLDRDRVLREAGPGVSEMARRVLSIASGKG
ncbi:IclR family transcriptional regulator [Roseomonas sp. SSH11]|uniref:IclR family transcriptional regulator n=1 Tax=Pararoseomonas baculiformis TaxID=2820812 RepID=A0ABS4AHA2_9PROT|nr:IclR family transcriptional regulator [Pararoseomonas baculiformis]MBP0446412.1 IclR family transcriptional regulator [Pararoseomonas baculiformis]